MQPAFDSGLVDGLVKWLAGIAYSRSGEREQGTLADALRNERGDIGTAFCDDAALGDGKRIDFCRLGNHRRTGKINLLLCGPFRTAGKGDGVREPERYGQASQQDGSKDIDGFGERQSGGIPIAAHSGSEQYGQDGEITDVCLFFHAYDLIFSVF